MKSGGSTPRNQLKCETKMVRLQEWWVRPEPEVGGLVSPLSFVGLDRFETPSILEARRVLGVTVSSITGVKSSGLENTPSAVDVGEIHCGHGGTSAVSQRG